jgi:hypothetical protein
MAIGNNTHGDNPEVQKRRVGQIGDDKYLHTPRRTPL